MKVEAPKCTDCGRCVRECPMDIRRVGDHECIHCGKCLDVCPTKAINYEMKDEIIHLYFEEDWKQKMETLLQMFRQTE